jgi:hypothetical protein
MQHINPVSAQLLYGCLLLLLFAAAAVAVAAPGCP